jgi:dTDP-4-amino-4,6-dideoxygalactose transaminase
MSKFLKISNPQIGLREIYAVSRVLKSGNLASGKKVSIFEERYSGQFNLGYCAAVNSGTSALLLSLLSLGVGPGDEVIVPGFTFGATANCVVLTGAIPVFADVNPRTFNIDIESIKQVFSSRTKAIVAVHLFGLAAEMDKISAFAKEKGILVIEDAAQAHGAKWFGNPVGSTSAATAFSFYATKNMTTGEGGMVASADKETINRIRLLRNQGMSRPYEYELAGFNNRMTEIQASIGLVQLNRLPRFTAARVQNAKFYSEELVGVTVPYTTPGYTHVYHQYVLVVEDKSRDRFVNELFRSGIETKVYYPDALNRFKYFSNTHRLEVSEKLAKTVLAIPVNPALKACQLERIVENVNRIASYGS